MAWLCTTMAGSMPILVASCSAAPSAFGPTGTGRVNDVCTIPSPVVSPYGRTIPSPEVPESRFWSPTEVPKSRFRLLSGMGDLPLEQVQGRVVGAGRELDHAVQPLAAVDRPLGDAERAVGDRVHQSAGMVGDPPEQLDRLAQHGVRPPVD